MAVFHHSAKKAKQMYCDWTAIHFSSCLSRNTTDPSVRLTREQDAKGRPAIACTALCCNSAVLPQDVPWVTAVHPTTP